MNVPHSRNHPFTFYFYRVMSDLKGFGVACVLCKSTERVRTRTYYKKDLKSDLEKYYYCTKCGILFRDETRKASFRTIMHRPFIWELGWLPVLHKERVDA